ncbi:MAG: phosphate acyltransferase [Propionibacteriaceae bacterium]
MIINTLAQIESLLLDRSSSAELLRVAVVKAADEHAIDSVIRAAKAGFVIPVFIDDEEAIINLIDDRLPRGDYEVVNISDANMAAIEGVRLIREGRCQILMKGHLTSGEFLKPVVNKETGIRTSNLLSHVAILENRDLRRLIALTDGGMMLTPTIEDLPALIDHARQVMAAMGNNNPKTALLSMAETVMPKLASSVMQAEYAASVADQEAVVEGPLSVDLALVPRSAKEKGWQGRIQGDADIIVAPDIVSANAFSKALFVFGNGLMAGLVLGASAPIVLVSRSATADEKYYSLLLAIAMGATR